MYASGIGLRAIERATGISHNTVINWLRQASAVLPEATEAEENSDSGSSVAHLKPLQPIKKFSEKGNVAFSLDAY
jgi:hypothetical protein